MANFGRTDSPGKGFEGEAGQQPIVLARLPYVGAAPSVAASRAAPPAPPMPAPPMSTVPLPEAMPQLDLRNEIDQRIRLHVANTPTVENTTTAHFADREHTVEHGPAIHQPVHQPATSTSSRQHSLTHRHSAKSKSKSKQHTTAAEPTTLSEKVFQLHSQLAPHAGLIVALALIASAGLLYWMIVGPTQAPMSPNFENYNESYGTETSDEGFGSFATQNVDHYVPKFSSKPPQPTEPTEEPDQWSKVLEMPSRFAQPEAKPASLPEQAIDEPLYPTTNHSHALDFSKLEAPTSEFPKALPEVARRPATTTNR